MINAQPASTYTKDSEIERNYRNYYQLTQYAFNVNTFTQTLSHLKFLINSLSDGTAVAQELAPMCVNSLDTRLFNKVLHPDTTELSILYGWRNYPGLKNAVADFYDAIHAANFNGLVDDYITNYVKLRTAQMLSTINQ